MKLIDINFWTACVEFHCETCNGKGSVGTLGCDPDWCSSCSGDGVVVVYLGTLLANLYAVGCAQMAFELGYDCRDYDGSPWLRDLRGQSAWRPNVDGKAAPGMGKS